MKRKAQIKKEIVDEERVGMKVYLFDIENGMREYQDVKMIKLKSSHYQLMILSDHTPLIGELDGTILILNKEEEIKLSHIKGFYSCLDNEFHFIQSGENYIEE